MKTVTFVAGVIVGATAAALTIGHMLDVLARAGRLHYPRNGEAVFWPNDDRPVSLSWYSPPSPS